jgi:hypothetical protein
MPPRISQIQTIAEQKTRFRFKDLRGSPVPGVDKLTKQDHTPAAYMPPELWTARA